MTAPNSAAARFRRDLRCWAQRCFRIGLRTLRVQADLDRLGIAGGQTATVGGRRRLCDSCGEEFAASNGCRRCPRCRKAGRM